MPRICTYILTHDSGLAPNPYWRHCTLAVCTPNRQGVRLKPGDWIAGFLPRDRGHRLVYAMEVSERLHLNTYFHDSRFEKKKPNLLGDWMARCGDNFYSQSEGGTWKQHRNRFHIGSEYLRKDTRRPHAFVAERFWYFGRMAPRPQDRHLDLVGGRGVRLRHDELLAADFRDWVATHDQGLHGLPNHNPDLGI
jgi:Nucleotide modification associated domain 2